MPAAPLDAKTFLACLKQSGLIPEADLAAFLDGRDGADAKSLATALVAEKRLTRWQAEKVLAGRCRGFRLGSYALLGLLGKGGMSAVYLGEHVVMKRRCAIKVLPSKLVGGGSHLERFMREARAVAALDHPNIVRAYDVASEGEGNAATHFLVMELVEGRSLYDLVKRDGPPSAERVRQIGHESAKGLAHAHAAGIVHRDVKPGNILLAKTGAVKVTDLGLARGGEDEEHSLTVAHDEKVLGTADYLAPEQALDSHAVDHRADIYGLGCTLYFSLCGHGPFTEGTLTQRLMAHQTKPAPPIESLVDGVPADFAAAIAKMLEKKPDDRFQTMDDVAAALAPAGTPDEPAAPDAAEEWRQREPAEPELSDFLAGLPAEAGSGAGPGSGVRSRTGRGRRRAGGASESGPPSAAEAGPRTPAPGGLGIEPGSADGGDLEDASGVGDAAAPGSGRFDFLGDADSAGLSAGGSGSVTAVGRGGEESDVSVVGLGSGVRVVPMVAPEPPSEVGSGFPTDLAPPASAARRVDRPRPAAEETGSEKPPARPPWPWLAAGAVGVLSAAAVAVWLAFGGADDPGGMTDGEEAVQTAEDRTPLTIGPDARFPTLAAALDHLRGLPDAGPDEPHVLLLPAGVLTEAVVADGRGFDFPPYVTVRGDAAGTTLRPAGGDPAVAVTGPLTGFTLENVAVDAGGRSVAVRLAGALTESRVSGLTVKDAAGTGVLLDGVSSDGLRVEDLRITGRGDDPTGGGALGVRVGSGGARDVTLVGGSIEKTAVGVDVAADVRNVTLDGLTLGPGTVGVRFGGKETGRIKLQNVLLTGLTLSGLERGVTFGNAPAAPTQQTNVPAAERGGLTIRDCAFGDTSQPVATATHLAAVKAVLEAEKSAGNSADDPREDPLDLFP